MLWIRNNRRDGKPAISHSEEIIMKSTRSYALRLAGCLLSGQLIAATLQLVTTRDPSLPQEAGANGDCASPWLSPDGRFVVYSSNASNLVTNDNQLFSVDAFLLDRASNQTVLVSANRQGTGGGNGHSSAISVSTNGQFVLFESAASDLVPGDTNSLTDIFVRDMWSDTTRLISVAADGGAVNGESSDPVMTPDGRYVAFISTGNNLVANDTNGIPDVFVRDLVNQTTVLASVGAVGTNAVVTSSAITPDGRWLAFFSTARGLVAGVSNISKGEIYLRDLTSGTTLWPSTNAITMVQAVIPFTNSVPVPSHPVISEDGRYVAFKSGWTNGTSPPPAGATAATVVMRYDTVANLTTIISTNGYPTPTLDQDEVYGPEMSPDGRFVAFVGREKVGASIYSSVQLWDEQTGTNVLASASRSGTVSPSTESFAPKLSSNGRFVAFISNATNIVSNVVVPGSHIYYRDMQAATTLLVDADTNGVASTDETLTVPSLSTDGAYLAYCGPDGDLVGVETNSTQDVFLWHAATATNELLSRRDPALISQSGNNVGAIGQIALSDDGNRMAYASYTSDLIANDPNRSADVFVWDRTSGSNVLVSVGLNGTPALGGSSLSPAISGDGRFVAFVSSATNLVAVDTNGAADIFLRDMQNGTTTLQSVNSNGVSLVGLVGTRGASSPVLSWDGRYLAFICITNSRYAGVFWRDTTLGITRLLPGSANVDRPPSISTNGQRVAYFKASSYLYVWDATTLKDIYTSSTSVSAAAISPGGNRLLHQASGLLVCYDLAGRSNLFSYASNLPIRNISSWSRDERFVTFTTKSNLVVSDGNLNEDVYLADLQTRTLTFVSANRNGDGSGNNTFDAPAISGDGRLVAYRSRATDVFADTVNPPGILVFDRLTGTNHLVTETPTSPGWSTWYSRPTINSSGDTIAFQSAEALLPQGDMNRVPDLFAGSGFITAVTNLSGLVSWWGADGNALDSVGTNNGILQGTVSFTNGLFGQAFLFNGGYVEVPDSPSLNFGPGSSASFSVWTYRIGPSLPFHIYGKRAGCSDDAGPNYQLGIDSAGPATPLNQWIFWTLVYSGGQAAVYTNGVLAGSWPDFGPTNSAPFEIGRSGTCENYFGLLDDLRIYNRALGTNEPMALYLSYLPPPAIRTQPANQSVFAGVTAAFSVIAGGALPLSYQWQFHGTNVAAATTATLTLPNAQLTNAGGYAVVVTNFIGAVISMVATLTVTPSVPVITSQPQSQSVTAGQDVAVRVAARGTEPLSYQWLKNGTNVLEGTGAVLPLPNFQAGDAGVYQVVVSNAVGTVTSSAATLGVVPIIAWGYNYYGQTNVPVAATNVMAVAAGTDHSLALRADGTVIAWGYGSYGQTTVPASATNVAAIAAGNYHSLALRVDGTAIAWGYNNYGQTTVPISATNIMALAGGYYHSLALRADGTAIAWGYNDYGQTNVPANATNVVAVAAGYFHNLAMRADGTVLAWGYNNYGQTNVPPSATNVVAVAAGYYHSLALRADGTVIAWGYNNYGQTNVPAIATNVSAVAGGRYHNLALLAPSFFPTVVLPMAQRTAYAGDTVTLVAAASGGLPLRYQWRCNGTNLANGVAIRGAQTTALTLFGVQTNDSGNYSLVVSNAYGSTTSSVVCVTVNIIPAPVIPIGGLGTGTNGSIHLSFSGLSNLTYSVWASTNLTGWTLLGSATQPTPGQFYYNDATATNSPLRFYRVRSP